MTSHQPIVLVDGREATRDELVAFALVNDGHFTAMQVRGGAVRGLDLHFGRLEDAHRTLYGTGLDLPRLRALMRAAVSEHPDAYLRVTVAEHEPGRPVVMTVVRPPVEPGTEPVALLPVDWSRAVPEVKHVGSFAQIHYWRLAERAGYDDALLIDPAGRINETTIANIAFIGPEGIVWPDGPALHGITRQLLQSAFPSHQRRAHTAPVTLADLDRFSSAVLVNSIGVAPVGRIGDHRFRDSTAAAQELDALYREVPEEGI